jgi:hypothetical protein
MTTNGATVVAVGDNGTIRYSTDGITWNTPTTVPSTENLNAINYAGSGMWIAVGAKGTVLTSSDAVTWAAQASNTAINLAGVATKYTTSTAAYTYVAVGAGGGSVKSNDGITWTSADVGAKTDLSAVAVTTTNSQFVAVGSAGTAFTSPDGITWTARTPSVAPNNCAVADWLGLISAQAQFVTVSSGGANCNSH